MILMSRGLISLVIKLMVPFFVVGRRSVIFVRCSRPSRLPVTVGPLTQTILVSLKFTPTTLIPSRCGTLLSRLISGILFVTLMIIRVPRLILI